MFVYSYGEKGALELYAQGYAPPRVICNHYSCRLQGVDATPITTVIPPGGARPDDPDTDADVAAAGVRRCR